MADVWWLLGGLAVLVALWFYTGGPGKADLRGLFVAPPQPLGSGESYGPTFGSSTDSTGSPQAEHVAAPAQDTTYTPPQY